MSLPNVFHSFELGGEKKTKGAALTFVRTVLSFHIVPSPTNPIVSGYHVYYVYVTLFLFHDAQYDMHCTNDPI